MVSSLGLAIGFVRVGIGLGLVGATVAAAEDIQAQLTASPPRSTEYFPAPESRGGWRMLTTSAEIADVAGMDVAKLAELRQWLLDSDRRNFAAVVIRHGYVVLQVERGNRASADSRRVASVSKAVCATVLAIASELSQQGRTPRRMTFDDAAFGFIPWAQPLSDGRKERITVRQLLNHSSGLCPEATGAKNEGSWDYILGHTGDARTAQLAFEPGQGSGYSTHAFYHAALVCETITGKPYDAFAREQLLEPLGCEHGWFEVFDGSEKVGRHASHGFGLPACELARIAYCMLRDGQWDGRQVIPRWFIAGIGRPHRLTGVKEMRTGRDAGRFAEGWECPTLLTATASSDDGGIPFDARYKPGSGGQLIAYVPSLDLVIARQTGGSGEWAPDEFLRRACEAVIARDATH